MILKINEYLKFELEIQVLKFSSKDYILRIRKFKHCILFFNIKILDTDRFAVFNFTLRESIEKNISFLFAVNLVYCISYSRYLLSIVLIDTILSK